MKVRNGFVSNSSSSSFVILGFTVPNDTYTDEFYLEHLYGVELPDDPDAANDLFMELSRERITIRQDGETGAPVGKDLIGIRLAGWTSTEYAEDVVIDLADQFDKVKELQEQLGGVATTVPIQLYIGTSVS